MGAAGHAEYDYWDDDDDDDDELVLASYLEDEETGKPSKPGQAEGEKVEAWLDETRSPGKRKRQRLAFGELVVTRPANSGLDDNEPGDCADDVNAWVETDTEVGDEAQLPGLNR